jgi:hypothetical protein
MSKKHHHHGHGDEETIENRVYLFRDLASAWLSENGSLLAAKDGRKRALKALADLARVSCVVADTGDRSPEDVAGLISSIE